MNYWNDLKEPYRQFQWATFIHLITTYNSSYIETIKLIKVLEKITILQ